MIIEQTNKKESYITYYLIIVGGFKNKLFINWILIIGCLDKPL